MDRTVPNTGSEAIELYVRTYYSLLRSTDTIKIDTLMETHKAMNSTLHTSAKDSQPDVSALVYSTLRLPPCIGDVTEVLFGQIEEAFIEGGWPDILQWERVYAPARRRRMHFDGKHTLAAFIASRSDIDDMVPTLTAFQIEWNKLHGILQSEVARLFFAQHEGRRTALTNSERDMLARAIGIPPEELQRLEMAWGVNFFSMLEQIAREEKHMGVRQVTGSLADYRRATAVWWAGIDRAIPDTLRVENHPVYFVSSNTHSLPNMLTGYAPRHRKDLLAYVRSAGHEELLAEYENMAEEANDPGHNNFLYYVLRHYLKEAGPDVADQIVADEKTIGIHRAKSRHGFDVQAQIIELNKLRSAWMDDRLSGAVDDALLSQSNALILNIDYPLGMAAYELLNRVTERTRLLGVYVMGKAATLNGRVNDVMIPNVVHDEHSQNTYLFDNCFKAKDVTRFMTFGNVLDNQKAISVTGTLLQNAHYMSVFYKEGFTDIEMEAGPYLSSIYEAYRPKRHPFNEIVNLYGVPFEIGFLHYASDTPLKEGANLSVNLGYAGVEPTYATTAAIVRRVLEKEMERMRGKVASQPQPEVHA